MNKLDAIKQIAEKVNGRVRKDYSGRFMYGKTCLGIVCEDPTEAIETAAQHGITNAKVDNMGLDYIVYWPNLK